MDTLRDVNSDQLVNMDDFVRIHEIAGLTLFKEVLESDLNQDGIVSEEDAELLKQYLFDELYFPLAVSQEEQKLFDVNRDGVLNFLDIRLLLEANSYYGSANLADDMLTDIGTVNWVDVQKLMGQLEAVYSREILTEEIRAYADVFKDGVVDDKDVSLFEQGLKYYRDVNGDHEVDIE